MGIFNVADVWITAEVVGVAGACTFRKKQGWLIAFRTRSIEKPRTCSTVRGSALFLSNP